MKKYERTLIIALLCLVIAIQWNFKNRLNLMTEMHRLTTAIDVGRQIKIEELKSPGINADSEFQKQVRGSWAKQSSAQKDMCHLSDSMVLAMNLTKDDLQKAVETETVWAIGEYDICVRSFPWNGWSNMLIVTPKDVSGNNAGYSNTNVSLPSSWHYRQKGTATEILPPATIQLAILDCLDEAKK